MGIIDIIANFYTLFQPQTELILNTFKIQIRVDIIGITASKINLN